MKKTTIVLLGLLTVVSLTVVSCKKKNPEPEQPKTTTPAGSTTPTPDDADGVMWAIRSTSTVQGFTIDVGTAVAVFTDGGSNLVNVGTVSVNAQNLTAASNNAYTFTQSTTTPTGISFNSTNWEITGANGHTAFTYDASSLTFPAGSAVSSSSTVNKANGYTLSCPSVMGADSTLFMVGNTAKTVAGNATSCTFSASELSGLNTGTSIVSIVPYKLIHTTINGKKYYFGKERVYQLSVTIE